MDHHEVASTLSWHGLKKEAEYVLKLAKQQHDLVSAVKGLDEAYCRAGTGLSSYERTVDRKRLIAARVAVEQAEANND